MSLSLFISFQSRFLTYLLMFPHIITNNIQSAYILKLQICIFIPVEGLQETPKHVTLFKQAI
jgi:hypothetical protein